MNVSMFVCMKRVTPSYIAYFDILTFEILTRGMVFLEESEVVDGLLRYLKKLRTGSPLLSSGHFFATRPLFSLFCTDDREPDTGYCKIGFNYFFLKEYDKSIGCLHEC